MACVLHEEERTSKRRDALCSCLKTAAPHPNNAPIISTLPTRFKCGRQLPPNARASPAGRGAAHDIHPRAGGRGVSRHPVAAPCRSEEHTSELQSRSDLVCRLLLEKKKKHDDDVVRADSDVDARTT